jgi:hypothetical protein
MMDKVQKQDSSKCITPSSEPFRTDLPVRSQVCKTFLHWDYRSVLANRLLEKFLSSSMRTTRPTRHILIALIDKMIEKETEDNIKIDVKEFLRMARGYNWLKIVSNNRHYNTYYYY